MASCQITAFHATLDNTEAFHLLSIREEKKSNNKNMNGKADSNCPAWVSSFTHGLL